MSAFQAELTDLIQLRFAARGIDLSSRRRLSRTQSGLTLANFRGRGIDFDQHRIYQAGDDIRNIDWRVTARTGKPHTKLFREEQERPVLIVVDYSATMWFGTRRAYKAVAAAEAAAVLAWAALDNNDKVGGQVFTESADVESRPRTGRNGVLGLLHQLAQPRPTSDEYRESPLAQSLEQLRHVVRPGTLIFVLSDFYHLDDAAVEQAALLARHCEMMAMHIVDPLETSVPPRGIYPVSNGQKIRMTALLTKQQRARFLQPYLQRCDQLQQLKQHRIHIRELSTAQPIDESLRQVLGTYHDQQVTADTSA